MKRSRLNLFKLTSMTISILGILLLVLFVGVIGYLVVSDVSSKVTSNVGSGSAYDTLASLKTQYSTLNNSYTAIKSQASASSNSKIRNDSIDAELQLVKAQSSITDLESALSTNQPQDVVNARLKAAIDQLQVTQKSVDTITGEV
ncbi:MAG TPA: hypothetical protein VHO92_06805 [Methanobacterium sp.]|nr:hypothetical protein [Methanobacterium sp.]